MRIQFQCTFDDFREANLGHLGAHQPGGKPRSLWKGLTGWLVFVVLAVVLMLMRASSIPSARIPASPAPLAARTLPTGGALTVRFLDASSMSLILCVTYAWALVRALLKSPRPAWLTPLPSNRVLKFAYFVIFGVVIAVVIRALDPARGTGEASEPSGYEMMLSTLPCAFIVLLLTLFAFARRKLDLKRRWAAQPFLHTPQVIETSDAGVTLEEPKSLHRYDWAYFPGFRETRNLLLLYVSPYGFWIVPKRAFSAEELQAFKAMLLTRIGQGTLLPVESAFPVMLGAHSPNTA